MIHLQDALNLPGAGLRGFNAPLTGEAMKVTHEALQLFAANGISSECPIGKMFRDTRSALIEDVENYTLTMRPGILDSKLYQGGWAQD